MNNYREMALLTYKKTRPAKIPLPVRFNLQLFLYKIHHNLSNLRAGSLPLRFYLPIAQTADDIILHSPVHSVLRKTGDFFRIRKAGQNT